ncbi:MAG TPA: DUF805 domain-containing protein [Gammaproteobacteria bacterium]|nr:DUF805 domain-containing protein [Gammaproteobacteria bacterium]
MATFSEAVGVGLQNYVNFSGRAARSEYWWWTLFVFIVYIATTIIDNIVFGQGVQILYPIALLILFLPGLAVSVRRLHDTGRSGWWLLLSLIPLIGTIILLIWFVSRGESGGNAYGPDPLAGSSPQPA